MTASERKLRKFLRDLYNTSVIEPGDIQEQINKIPELLGLETNEFGFLPQREPSARQSQTRV
jgi:hypothetical protein